MSTSSEISSTLLSDAMQIPAGHTLITEGSASIFSPLQQQAVFYNPAQVVNRDLSTLVIQHFIELRRLEALEKYERLKLRRVGSKLSAVESTEEYSVELHSDLEDAAPASGVAQEALTSMTVPNEFNFPGVTICEALSATGILFQLKERSYGGGLRAIRYARELRHVRRIVANDRDQHAVDTIAAHVRFNRVPEGLVQPNHDDACDLMARHRHTKDQFDVIDLDPYGSASIFLNDAVQSVADGGLICVTCTDMAVLCGSRGEACYAKYGAYPLKSSYCHEQALRIVLGCIESNAARHKRFIVPLLSLSIDFYVRVFVRVYTSPLMVKKSASKMAYLYQCVNCDHFAIQRVGKLHLTPAGGTGRKTVVAQTATSLSVDDTLECRQYIKFAPATASLDTNKCPHCNSVYQMGGPLWAENLHDVPFVETLIESLLLADNKVPDIVTTPIAPTAPEVALIPISTMDIDSAISGISASSVAIVDPSLANVASRPVYPVPCTTLRSPASPLLYKLRPQTAIFPFAARKRVMSLLALAAQVCWWECVDGKLYHQYFFREIMYYEEYKLELDDVPFYYEFDAIASTLHSTTPKASIVRSALVAAGYRVSMTHANIGGLKTDAPTSAIYDLYRAWIYQQQLLSKPAIASITDISDTVMSNERRIVISTNLSVRSPAFAILSAPLSRIWNFSGDTPPPLSKYHLLAKFFTNPENWGPKSAASSGKRKTGPDVDKRAANQNKSKKLVASSKTTV